MRMDADRESALGPGREHRRRASDLRVVFGGENDERARHPGRARPFDDGRQVGDELLAGDVAVTVDQGRLTGATAPVTWNW